MIISHYGRFRRYSAGEAIAEAEIDLLFHWQKPSRRAIHIDETGEGKVDYEKLAEKEAKEEGDRRSSAAVKIQSAFRGMVGRAIFKVEVERQRRLANESAEKIQCAYRGMVGRKIFKQKWLEKGLPLSAVTAPARPRPRTWPARPAWFGRGRSAAATRLCG